MLGPLYPEFGIYVLPGHVSDSKAISQEIRTAEQIGVGSVWVSERLSTKNVEVLSGFAAASTARMGIASGIMANLPLRHPLVTAGYASTMMKLTDDRFALGVGRASDIIADRGGIPKSTFRVMEDYLAILRKLWKGEAVNYSGSLGSYTDLTLGGELSVIPPVIMAVMGEKTAYWAGQHCDGVLYNSMVSSAAAARLTRCVRQGAIDAGRDPKRVKVWAILVTASDVSEETVLRTVIRRMNTYAILDKSFRTTCTTNGWDIGKLEEIKAALDVLDGRDRDGPYGDEATSSELAHLQQMRDLYPQQWIEEGFAVGSARYCVEKALERFHADVDGILFHGAAPQDLRSLLAIWPEHRPADLFNGRVVNPGL